MSAIFLANTVAIAHGLLIISVFIGIFLSIRVQRFRPVEAGILLSAIVIWSLYGACPLTTLEQELRNQAGQNPPLYELGFIAFYVKTLFQVSITPQLVTIITYAMALVFLVLSIEWELPLIRKWQKKLLRHS